MLDLMTSPAGSEIVIDGRRYVNFGGSSYLGLSRQHAIIESGVASLRETGAGYQFPHRYGVTYAGHRDAEAEAARFFGTEDALYLSGGYLFGLIGIAVLQTSADVIYYDELAHFALRDAIATSPLPAYAYRHRDVEDLRAHLSRGPSRRPLVVTDGLFSTFGRIAPLDALADLVKEHDGWLLIDESHSFGVLGAFGRGACEHFGLDQASILVGGSTAKGFGVTGGILPATRDLVARSRETRAGRGSSQGLAAAAAMCAASMRYVSDSPDLLRQLRDNVRRLKSGLAGLGLETEPNLAPIAAITLPSADETSRLRARLLADGIFVFHSNYVGAGEAGVLRIGIFADHSPAHIDALLEALGRYL